jgi:hypothetical protein
MFSKHTFGARTYGHYRGYREPGISVPPMTQKQWRHFLQQMKRNKELRARRTGLETGSHHPPDNLAAKQKILLSKQWLTWRHPERLNL